MTGDFWGAIKMTNLLPTTFSTFQMVIGIQKTYAFARREREKNGRSITYNIKCCIK
jgi:hypothetical protein